MLHAKDLLRALQAADGDLSQDRHHGDRAAALVRARHRPLSEQLKAFRRRKTISRWWSTSTARSMGLVTLEDILEEIVGDIADEHDIVVPGVRPQPDGSVNVDGAVPIRDLNRAMDWNLPDEEATTIAGLVIHEARSIPEPGQTYLPRLPLQVLRRSATASPRCASRRSARPAKAASSCRGRGSRWRRG